MRVPACECTCARVHVCARMSVLACVHICVPVCASTWYGSVQYGDRGRSHIYQQGLLSDWEKQFSNLQEVSALSAWAVGFSKGPGIPRQREHAWMSSFRQEGPAMALAPQSWGAAHPSASLRRLGRGKAGVVEAGQLWALRPWLRLGRGSQVELRVCPWPERTLLWPQAVTAGMQTRRHSPVCKGPSQSPGRGASSPLGAAVCPWVLV